MAKVDTFFCDCRSVFSILANIENATLLFRKQKNVAHCFIPYGKETLLSKSGGRNPNNTDGASYLEQPLKSWRAIRLSVSSLVS
jgi:hypothetical protein